MRWLLVGVLVWLILFSFIDGQRISNLSRTAALQEARIEGLEQSELQMRGQWQPPDTVFIVPDSARVW